MVTNINTILNWFKTGYKPTQSQFWAAWASFWHKDEQIPQNSISGLENALNAKVEKSQLDAHLSDNKAHSELFDKKANSVHNHIIDDIEGLENVLNDKATKKQLDTHAKLIDTKVDKIDGMDLSQENFTSIFKNKLEKLKNIELESNIQIIEIEATELTSLDVEGIKKWLDAKIDLQLNIGADIYIKIIGINTFTKEFTKEYN